MTGSPVISLAARVTSNEEAAIRLAATSIARTLGDAGGVAHCVDCTFAADAHELRDRDDGTIFVMSLLPEVDHLDEPWPESERRLRETYATLTARGRPVCICTIFRHVSRDDGRRVAETRLRIRRLNLLAAELSRETGAYVIDFDRVFADIGARRAGTDYRLAGETAIALAAHTIARSLIGNALDTVASIEVQAAAIACLDSLRPAVPASAGDEREMILRSKVQMFGKGRRVQAITPVKYDVQQIHLERLARRVLRGSMRPQDVMATLSSAVRRHGIRKCAWLVAYGLARQIRLQKR